MKTKERAEARRLRRERGLPLKEIARELGVAVSSVSVWVRDIELTPAQHEALRALNPAYNHQRNGSRAIAAHYRAERTAAQQEGRKFARIADPFHVAGCMLYWAEGSKERNQVQFTNADPDMARFFVKFLTTYFEISPGDVRITCHLFADHVEKQHEVERFWLDYLGLPDSSLRKSVVNRYSKWTQKKRCNRLPYGTCRIVVSRTRVTQHIYGAIQEYAGFARPEWLE